MTDAISTDPPRVLDAGPKDARTARQRILSHFEDSEGGQTTAQICVGTGLARALVDPLLSRLTKQRVLDRIAQATYRLAPPKSLAESPPPSQRICVGGTTAEEWLRHLWGWHETGAWDGPGSPPDKVEGIMSSGCAVPLDVWMTFLGQCDALAKLRAADAILRDRLMAAAHGNVACNAKLDDMRAIRIMIASGIEIDLIEMAVRQKHDRRIYPRNPPLASWPDLLGKVADLYARSVLAPKLVGRWNAALADPGATTAASPTLRRAMSELSPQPAARASEPVAAVKQPPPAEVAPAPSPQRAAVNPDDEGPPATTILLERYGAGLDAAVEAVSGNDDDEPATPSPRPGADGREQILAAFNRGRERQSQPAAPPVLPSRPPADRDEIAAGYAIDGKQKAQRPSQRKGSSVVCRPGTGAAVSLDAGIR